MSYAMYKDFANDSAVDSKHRERELLERSNRQLAAVQHEQSVSTAVIMAVNDTQQIWMALIQDLTSPGNGYPEDLKKNLIEIGVFICRAANLVIQGEFRWIKNIIALNEQIVEGLSLSEAAA